MLAKQILKRLRPVYTTGVSIILIAFPLIVPYFPFGKCTMMLTPLNVGTSPYRGSNVDTAVHNGIGGTVLCFSSGTYGAIEIYAAHCSGVVTMRPSPLPAYLPSWAISI